MKDPLKEYYYIEAQQRLVVFGTPQITDSMESKKCIVSISDETIAALTKTSTTRSTTITNTYTHIYTYRYIMGNTAAIAKGFEDRELGEAHLDASSPKVIDSRCVTRKQSRLVRKGKQWYLLSKYNDDNDDDATDGKEEFVFGITKKRQFAGVTQVIVDQKDEIMALLQTTTNGGKGTTTLVYRPTQTFENQLPSLEVYTEKELKKKTKEKKKEDLPKYYLFARIQSSAASKCDANYALLQVHEVYNDPDFAKFQDPPLYRAAKVISGGMGSPGFAAAVMDGTDHGGETLLGKVTTSEAELSNGVDIIAVLCLALSVNQSGTSAKGVDASGVV